VSTYDRKSLAFEQAEGFAPLPAQLDRKVMSKELRAKLWAYVHSVLGPAYADILHRKGRWHTILIDLHVNHYHSRIDKYNQNGIIDRLGNVFEKEAYQKVYGWLEAVLKHDHCPPDFPGRIQNILEECRAPYRIDDDVIWPLASTEEADAVKQAIVALAPPRFSGARSHLKNAGSKLTQGDYAGSVRESISAVESIARVLEPTGDLAKALTILEQKAKLHPALKRAFLSLYGYTSDEKGIRHSLLSEEEAAVDEIDAVFFIGVRIFRYLPDWENRERLDSNRLTLTMAGVVHDVRHRTRRAAVQTCRLHHGIRRSNSVTVTIPACVTRRVTGIVNPSVTGPNDPSASVSSSSTSAWAGCAASRRSR
jgi:hypothetical protein